MSAIDTFNKLKYTDSIPMEDVDMYSIEIGGDWQYADKTDQEYDPYDNYGDWNSAYISFMKFKNGGELTEEQIMLFSTSNEEAVADIIDYHING